MNEKQAQRSYLILPRTYKFNVEPEQFNTQLELLTTSNNSSQDEIKQVTK